MVLLICIGFVVGSLICLLSAKKTCDNLWISLRCFFVEWNPECRILDSQVSCAGIFFTDNFVQELQATAANRTF